MTQKSSENRPTHTPDGKFAPGNCANPGGRPKGSVSLVTILRAKLAEVPVGEKKAWAQTFVEQTLADAMAGDSQARKLVWEYMEGTAKQTVELQGGFDVNHFTESELDREIADLCRALGSEAASLLGAEAEVGVAGTVALVPDERPAT